MTKIVTVVGATGAQGRAVVNAFLNNPAYKVRAITRNPSGAAGQALAAKGAEVVSADLNDLEGLTKAFAGSHVIFGMTNFFEPFIAHQDPIKAMEVEVQQGTNLARAAAATATLEHYIWSTLPNALAVSAGKYLVPHFEGKNRVDAYIREREPALLRKTTFLWVGFYSTNYAFPMYTPYPIPTAGKHVQFANFAPDTPISSIGDVAVNLTPFVRAVVEQRARTAGGAIVLAVSSVTTAADMLQTWARARGVQAQIVRVSGRDYRDLWPLWADEIGIMNEYWDEYREKSWSDPAGAKVLTKEDLGVQDAELQSLEVAFKALEL
ncbi:uncharacterized protein THITE_2110969 [Thermothielavioides terrestris NRRL 8126]|jgi:hypothetical protein|uniref:NmrA-like domain-containing protein n=1 Tax=Thermothielavioides terrestris (strain ATCC 38088 / NRRL 8126) TaxID=578455 RepID=G2QVJ0_THETT|nr:uncharacterized protein THITE_2110969 [Thermothielavioides terrestris NRRL 8126]AEO64680.1 hypothetical protein THITE_2110969 [Thermothielavioides terrestris NRRL 8126]